MATSKEVRPDQRFDHLPPILSLEPAVFGPNHPKYWHTDMAVTTVHQMLPHIPSLLLDGADSKAASFLTPIIDDTPAPCIHAQKHVIWELGNPEELFQWEAFPTSMTHAQMLDALGGKPLGDNETGGIEGVYLNAPAEQAALFYTRLLKEAARTSQGPEPATIVTSLTNHGPFVWLGRERTQ
ncbi:hypothetical protein HYS00_01195 [Candidatus Microgenomates bacterium]|nr:hypothetical protein [Candidatus Microgenomates bacterium]